MKKVFTVNGMMCAHCAGRVKTALETVPGVKSADVSIKKKRVSLECEGEIDNAVLASAVKASGYEAEF